MAQHPAYSLLWHLILAYELHGQQCQNGFYFSNRISLHDQESWIEGASQLLGGHFQLYMLPWIMAFQNQEVHYIGTVTTQLIPAEGPVWESPIANQTGAQPDESLPSYCAGVLSLRTGLSGKSNRGRLYFAGVPEDQSASSELNAISHSWLTDIGDQLKSIYGPAGSEGHFHHVVFSKKHGYINKQFLTAGIRPITQYVPRRIIGTQRHRLKGKGN